MFLYVTSFCSNISKGLCAYIEESGVKWANKGKCKCFILVLHPKYIFYCLILTKIQNKMNKI